MKRIILFALSSAFVLFTEAQIIKGKLIDASTKTPLAGATIMVDGRNVTTTDKDGTFTFHCSKPVIITVSFIGYEAQKMTAGCNEDIVINLLLSAQTLDNVEITATSNQNKSLLFQPLSITKLGPMELQRGNGLFLDDAINSNVPGVTMNRRAVSSGQQFNIRGYGNGTRGTRGISSNFDGQGYKVYLNGIPVTDAEGITTLDDIDFGSVGNVEVVKGPAGTLYGLAIAGVVNLETIKPEKGTSAGQDVLIGNYGLQRFTTHFQTATDKSSLLINYGHQKSNGFTIHNTSKKDFVNAAGNFQLNLKQALKTYFGYSNSYDERSGELTPDQYNNNDFSGNINYIRNNAHSEVVTVRAGMGHTYLFNSQIANTTTVFGTSLNSNASSAGGWSDKSSTNLGLRSTVDTKFNWQKGITLSGITGIETQRQNAQTIGYSMKISPFDNQTTSADPWVVGRPYYIINTATSNNATATATTSVFTEWTLALPHDLSLTGGTGVSIMKIKLDDRFNTATAGMPSQYDTTYKGMLSPHVAINKVFNAAFSAYASYSTAYKAPVSSYFYVVTPAVTTPAVPATSKVNSALRPEKGEQIEVGTKGSLLHSKLSYQLALFHISFSNKMTTIAVPNPNNTATLYSYVVNGGNQDHKGVEVFAKYTIKGKEEAFFSSITPFVNFTYSDFKYENYTFITGTTSSNQKTYDFSGSPVAGVSKVVASLGIDVTTAGGWYGNINYLYRDKMPITSPDTLYASSYNLLNGKLGYRKKLSPHFDFDLSLGVNNLAGTKYPIMVFVNQLPDAYIAGPVKTNYFVTLKLNYIF